MKKPEPINIKVPTMNDKIMYSMMDEFSLRRLRNFIDELIQWKAAGHDCHIATILFAIKEQE